MGVSMKVSAKATIGGKVFSGNATETANTQELIEAEIPVGKAGTLTTRTDANTGSITMSAGGHGITTGARVDIYSSGGVQRGVTVGTVSGNTIPFDSGVGDDLPAQASAVVVSLCQEFEFTFEGDDLKGLAIFSTEEGIAVIAESDDSELLAKKLNAASAYQWYASSGETNPLVSQSVGKVFFSNKSTTKAATSRIGAIHN